MISSGCVVGWLNWEMLSEREVVLIAGGAILIKIK